MFHLHYLGHSMWRGEGAKLIRGLGEGAETRGFKKFADARHRRST